MVGEEVQFSCHLIDDGAASLHTYDKEERDFKLGVNT